MTTQKAKIEALENSVSEIQQTNSEILKALHNMTKQGSLPVKQSAPVAGMNENDGFGDGFAEGDSVDKPKYHYIKGIDKMNPVLIGSAPTAEYKVTAKKNGSGSSVSGTSRQVLDDGSHAIGIPSFTFAQLGIREVYGHVLSNRKYKKGGSHPVFVAQHFRIPLNEDVAHAFEQLAQIVRDQMKLENES